MCTDIQSQLQEYEAPSLKPWLYFQNTEKAMKKVIKWLETEFGKSKGYNWIKA